MHKAGGILAKLTKKPYSILCNVSGRMGERCNLSDWEGKANVGELPGGSCWCEVAAMLTCFELPAVYVNADAGFTFDLDHVKSRVQDGVLTLENPTAHDAVYRIFAENEAQRKNRSPKPLCWISKAFGLRHTKA